MNILSNISTYIVTELTLNSMNTLTKKLSKSAYLRVQHQLETTVLFLQTTRVQIKPDCAKNCNNIEMCSINKMFSSLYD